MLAKKEKTEEKNGDAKAEKPNHTSTASKDEKPENEDEDEEIGRITLGEIAAIERNLASNKVDNLQPLHTVSSIPYFSKF